MPCHDIFEVSGIDKMIKKNGYGSLETACKALDLQEPDHFISSSTSPVKKLQLFVSVYFMSRFLLARNDDLSLIMGHKLKALEDFESKKGHLDKFHDEDIKIAVGKMHLPNISVGFKTIGDDIYLSVEEVLQALELEKIVSKRGFAFIDKPLKSTALTVSSLFLYTGKCRTFVHAAALLSLIDSGILKKCDTFKAELLNLLLKEASMSASIKKQTDTPKRKPFQKLLEVNSTPKVQEKEKAKARRPLFKTKSKKKKKKKKKKKNRVLP